MQGSSGHYQAVEQFFAVWHTYQKVVTHNHLHHREIGEALKALVAGTWPQEPIAVLDLGCGDAAELAPALASVCVSSYTGVDLAAPALELARGNLRGLRCAVKLIKSNYSGLLDALTGSYDLIHNSYSLHHLCAEDKAAYFHQCRRLLAPGGLHVLIDGLRAPHESRDAGVARHVRAVHEQFGGLSASERRSIAEHMEISDFPESEDRLRSLAAAAGLGGWQALFKTPLYGMFVCRAVNDEA